MKLKHYIFTFSLFVSVCSYSQPDPTWFYPEKIKNITEQLKTDSLNYKLIWERLGMSITLLNREQFHNVFIIYPNETTIEQINYYKEIDYDFKKVYNNVVKLKNFEYLEAGDYYLTRMEFYGKTLQLDKAISDAYYLRDSASYSKYWERGKYYNYWAVQSLFRLFVLKKDYANALKTVNTILEKQKNESPKLYFTQNSSSYDKIKLFEYFEDKEKIIPYLKQLCRENFEWYFEKASSKDSNPDTWHIAENEYYTSKDDYVNFMEEAKASSFAYLVKLIGYLKQFNNKELPKYETIYNQIRWRINENSETINPKISDEELKSIVSAI